VIVFEVDAISHDINTSGDLVSQLEGLSIDPVSQIWTVGWDTTVTLQVDALRPLELVNVGDFSFT
jgi:hypothetical protein